jgi:hypothetical protein
LLNCNPCKGCQQILPINAFYSDKTKPSGLRGKCKDCQKNDTYIRKNQDLKKWNEKRAVYALNAYYRNHAESKERNKLKERKRRIDNHEHVKSLEAEQRKKNRTAIRNRQRLARQSNPAKYKGIDNARYKLPKRKAWTINSAMIRRARRQNCKIFKVTANEIMNLYAKPCVICQSINKIQIDHIIPLARNGTHSIGNLQPLCAKHNLSKGTKTMTEWRKDGLD